MDSALRVLLIDDGAQHLPLIRDELTRLGYIVVGVIDSAPLIHDCVLRTQPDIVIVDAESPSRDTLEHLAVLSAEHPRPVIVFSEDGSADPLRHSLQAGVSAYVVAGLQPQRLAPVMQVAIARFEQDKALRAELDEARQQLDARKTIDQAKRVLMTGSGMTEDQAHRHLRKLAMDRGERIPEVAQRVIDAAALLTPTPPRRA